MTRCGYATEMSYHRADRQLPDDGENLQDRIMLRGFNNVIYLPPSLVM